jgi:hypothetical protein
VRRGAARLLLLAAALAPAGCGYALLGHGVTVDPSIKRIGVPAFRDTTGKAGLEQKISQKVIEELLSRGKWDVVPESTGVDALVEGELIAYNVVPVGFSEGESAEAVTTQTQASRYAIVLTARVRYAKTGQSEALWENDAFSTRDEYDVGDDPAAFFDREEQAIDRLASTFARSLVSAMLEAF